MNNHIGTYKYEYSNYNYNVIVNAFVETTETIMRSESPCIMYYILLLYTRFLTRSDSLQNILLL